MSTIVCCAKAKSFQSAVIRGISSCQTKSNAVLQAVNLSNQKSSNGRPHPYQHSAKRNFRSSAAICKKKSFYDVLGVSQSATKEEIKSKYREMAKKCHPDLNRDDKNAEKKFREITEAYEVLESDSKRQTYDNYGHEGVEVCISSIRATDVSSLVMEYRTFIVHTARTLYSSMTISTIFLFDCNGRVVYYIER